MMPKILLILLCLIFLLTACDRQVGISKIPSTVPSTAPEDTSDPASTASTDVKAVSETLITTNSLLAKYIKSSGNSAISFVGLGDLMNKVKTEAETASEYTTECLVLTDQIPESVNLSEYNEQFLSVQLNLSALNDIMKEAKQNRDIDEIKTTLTDILSELQNYNKLLEQFLEEER
ncbi:hypothetical protein Q5O14_11435 [Eubacteriaceae bacterium ES2]|nr:hypothetical protein Q5O14_11435 [Eubacteriaceae bacterium ES2]